MSEESPGQHLAVLHFLMPLKSPAVCRDWDFVSRLTERAIRSVCQQDHPAFHLTLVCHERPRMEFTHPALTIIEEPGFPVPGKAQEERMADKSRKLWRGLVALRTQAPAHLMFVDADDCVSRRLAGHVAADPANPGWYVGDGYVHDHGSRWILQRRDFHLLCGTSHLLRVQPEDLPQSTDEREEDYWIGRTGHTEMVNLQRDRGTPLTPLPFRGAVYCTATGESWSGLSLKDWHSRRILLYKLLNYRPCTEAIRREFGLYHVPQ